MIPMGSSNDEWIAAIGSYIRNAFGNRAAIDHSRRRRARARRDGDAQDPVDVAELEASLPQQVVVDPNVEAHRQPQLATARDALSISRGPRACRRRPACGCRSSCRSRRWSPASQFESPAALVDTEPAVPGAPTRTGIGGGRGGGRWRRQAFPRGYEVQVSMDGTTWGKPVAKGRARA